MTLENLISKIDSARNRLQNIAVRVPEEEPIGLDREEPDFEIRYPPNPLPDYDRSQAVEYARRFAYSHNPEYVVYNSNCTNFATQVLIAGGAISYDEAKDEDGLNLSDLGSKDTWDTKNWGPNKRRLDPEFLRAKELPDHLEDIGLASSRDIAPGTSQDAVYAEAREFLKPGDLIQYETDPKSEGPDHINVFLGFNEEGVPMIANNSPGRITAMKWDQVTKMIHINEPPPKNIGA